MLEHRVADAPYTTKSLRDSGWAGERGGWGTDPMCFSCEDVASIGRMASTLEREAVRLGPVSHIADVWRDWGRLLSPVVDEAKREQP